MAIKSVIEVQASKRGRSKHDVEMVDAVSVRLDKARAVLDLLMTVDTQQLFKDTVADAGGLVIDLLDEARALVTEEERAAA